jgi:ABC-type lipoprotein release transport system permease subunit
MPMAPLMPAEIIINDVFSSNVPSAEANQVYIPLQKLQEMMLLKNEATHSHFSMTVTQLTEQTSNWLGIKNQIRT